jgi:uncharacterized membrane protein YeaQ/YmgE (transglycosylase-associated protein family)
MGLAHVSWPVGGTGVLTGWPGAASARLEPWGPIGYMATGLAGALIAAWCLALVGFWLERMARARFIVEAAVTPRTINPLEQTFIKLKISLQDCFSPFMTLNEGKTFIECHLHGHAIVVMLGDVHLEANDLSG